MINRTYDLDQLLKPNKALIIYGARQVGKTTLLKHFLSKTAFKYKLDSGDNLKTQQILSSRDFNVISEYASGYELIAIDEAQNIPQIGTGLKILVDQIPEIRVIATGSSSFDLSGAVGEPLTGRKTTIILYPIAQQELLSLSNHYELKERLEQYLVFGSYPEVIMAQSRLEKIALLEELMNSYLLKDVLSLDRLKSPKTLLDLLKLLAFQVGSPVSLNEIATQLKIDAKTVARYTDILEKAFVLKRIGGFNRNLRNEVVSKSKYYFLDNGIRNAVISQFNNLDQRNDVGLLWENFLMVERLKKRAYQGISGSSYYWRTYEGRELDLIEEREGKLLAFEFKWSAGKKDGPPKDWRKAYPESEFQMITRENYLEFIL